jgi:hypothetical protein
MVERFQNLVIINEDVVIIEEVVNIVHTSPGSLCLELVFCDGIESGIAVLLDGLMTTLAEQFLGGAEIFGCCNVKIFGNWLLLALPSIWARFVRFNRSLASTGSIRAAHMLSWRSFKQSVNSA